MLKRWSLLCTLLMFLSARAQHNYVAPSDPLVQAKLEQWQDLKFGLFMHWGTYSQWGVVESWSICPEDEGWTQRKGPNAASYFEYKKAYENLQSTFNPGNFHPEKWAQAARDAGMKYVVFTTKHHDGFCMFDTHQTDYRVTSPHTPFSANPRSNIAREVFEAFRQQHFLTGAYFSKPDWHNENYWWPYFPPKDRNVNYDPAKYPQKWEAFKQFTFNQIEELMTGYGKMDILWLDGGWVRPLESVDPSVEWQKSITYNQDIDMKKIASMARSHQPGLLVVDRSVGGAFENYQTPEQEVPEKPLAFPWETCMTMGNSWSFVPGDHYKSSHELIQLLVKVVSRGGNFLLNIGPGPDGDWDSTAYTRLREIGDWMKINGEGIYASRSVAPYSYKNCYFTQSRDGAKGYAFYLAEGPEVLLDKEVILEGFLPPPGTKISLLGYSQPIPWKAEGNRLTLKIPGSLQHKPVARHAAVFRFIYPTRR